MPLDAIKIIEQLDFLRTADGSRQVFGSIGHDYQLRPVLDETSIAQFEQRYSVVLPGDYRQFLLEVGNGGAGPYHGILGLDQLYETNEDYWNDLSAPFSYIDQWLGPPDLLKAMDQAGEADDDDRQNELADEYWRVADRNGSISICEYGCNLRFLLILKGQEYGHIWFDATSDIAGYCPVSIHPRPSFERDGEWCITDQNAPKETRVSFSRWYHAWLDWACQYVERVA